MKNMIPAVAGTFLLVPYLDAPDDAPDETFYDKTRVPVLGWSNYSALKDDAADLRTTGTPIVPFWPEGVSQAAGYVIPDGDGGLTVSVPFARRSFYGANAMAQYDHFAEEVLRGMEEARNQEEAVSGENWMAAGEPQGKDQGDGITIELPTGHFTVTPEEDTREVGTTLTGNTRRSKEEIAADETFLEVVKGLGKTIRAVNTRWKTMPSRTAVLLDLAGNPKAEDPAPAGEPGNYEDDDEDLIG